MHQKEGTPVLILVSVKCQQEEDRRMNVVEEKGCAHDVVAQAQALSELSA